MAECILCKRALTDAWEETTQGCRSCHATLYRRTCGLRNVAALLVALLVVGLCILRLRGVFAALHHPMRLFVPLLVPFVLLCHWLARCERRMTDHTPPEQLRP